MTDREHSPKVDIGILTVRPDEFEALLSRLPEPKSHVGKRHYNLSLLPSSNGTSLRIAILRTNEQGTGEAQNAAADLIHDLAPRWILVVGIAGGMPSEDFTLGDVILSTRILDFSVRSEDDGMTTFALAGGPTDKSLASLFSNLIPTQASLAQWNEEDRIGVLRPTTPDLSKSSNFYGDKGWVRKVRKALRTNLVESNRKPKFITGAVASSDTLVKDVDLASRLKDSSRQVIAVEMEIAGAYRVASAERTPIATIRGISDIIGLNRTQNSNWTEYACHTAASFTIALLSGNPFFSSTEPTASASPATPSPLSEGTQTAPAGHISAKTQAGSDIATPKRDHDREETSTGHKHDLGAPESDPESVFTPRQGTVNEQMYIKRPQLEAELLSRTRESRHIILHGESGSGKTWLYKSVFRRSDIHFSIVNLANASRYGSIADSIWAKLKVSPPERGSNAIADSLLKALEELRNAAGTRQCCLVLDNLESVFGRDELMIELGDLITLLDDEDYEQHNVKFVIVGVPSGVKDYFAKMPNKSTVSNRLVELSEVASLTAEQVHSLVQQGFIRLLKYEVESGEDALISIANHVEWVTMGVPQRIHEYCLELAKIARDEDCRLSNSQLVRADQVWMKTSLSNASSTIDKHLNERETKTGRRNQVLYCLGQMEEREFWYTDVEEKLREEFPRSTDGKTLDISGIMSKLAQHNDIIRRTHKGDRYVFVDNRVRMCIRAMLVKAGEQVERRGPHNLLVRYG